jgi:predicted glycoside hydrolase/deacetylase ChbG (UPF0249 family)
MNHRDYHAPPSRPRPPAVAIRCDDAGTSIDATRGCLVASRDGIARNISLLCTAPDFERSAEMLSHLDSRQVLLGFHAAINCEWHNTFWPSVAQAHRVRSLLTEDGHLTRSPADLESRLPDPSELRIELSAQLDRAARCGIQFDYIDEHMNFSRLPGLRQEVRDFAHRHGLLDVNARPDLYRHADLSSARSFLSSLKAHSDSPGIFVFHPVFDSPISRMFSLDPAHPASTSIARDTERRLLIDPLLIDSLSIAFESLTIERLFALADPDVA